ncbi:MAG: hypothetical protein AAGF12_05770 [Myxococcota bacterium]
MPRWLGPLFAFVLLTLGPPACVFIDDFGKFSEAPLDAAPLDAAVEATADATSDVRPDVVPDRNPDADAMVNGDTPARPCPPGTTAVDAFCAGVTGVGTLPEGRFLHGAAPAQAPPTDLLVVSTGFQEGNFLGTPVPEAGSILYLYDVNTQMLQDASSATEGLGVAFRLGGTIEMLGGGPMGRIRSTVVSSDLSETAVAHVADHGTLFGWTEIDGDPVVVGGAAGIGSATRRFRSVSYWQGGSWQLAPPLMDGRETPFVVRTSQGVVVGGGLSGPGDRPRTLSSVELYSDLANPPSPLPNLPEARTAALALPLQDDRFVVVGGCSSQSGEVVREALQYERFGGFRETGLWEGARAAPRYAEVEDDLFLVCGGTVVCDADPANVAPTSRCDLFDASTGSWTRSLSMMVPRVGHSMTNLGNGRIAIVGGLQAGRIVVSSSVEVHELRRP